MPDHTRRNAPVDPSSVERPEPSAAGGVWASDAIAEALRAVGIPFVALTPGASYRGLQDSIVNHLGNEQPQMLLCLHEEHAVSIAHGWAKVTGTPMGAIVHSNVGLMHATMAVFNAWCDRVPLLLLGATGPVDAEKRRPWIDWIHTAKDQGALIRDYTKWDDQPASTGAAIESILRANMIARTPPCAPVYVCLDAGMQETPLDAMPGMPAPERFQPPRFGTPDPVLIGEAARHLGEARRPLILAGRVSRDPAAWADRVRLAEALGACVLTDLKTAAAFPTAHRLHPAGASVFPTDTALRLLRGADVVLSLDWVDLGGTLRQAWPNEPARAHIVHASLDQLVHNGWSMDHQALPPVDIALASEPDATVAALLRALDQRGKGGAADWPEISSAAAVPSAVGGATNDLVTMQTLAKALAQATQHDDVCLVRVPSAWAGDLWPFNHPLDYLGIDGGAGLGSGPGLAIGAALALRGTGRLPVAVLGDGDFMMGCTSLWTAAHYGIAPLIVVANNRSLYNDEQHQERVARQRGRPVANKWIGQRITDPEIDVARIAEAQGAVGIGPVHRPNDLAASLGRGLDAVRSSRPAVVDVRIQPGVPR